MKLLGEGWGWKYQNPILICIKYLFRRNDCLQKFPITGYIANGDNSFLYITALICHYHTPPDVVSIEGLRFEKVVENE